MSRTKHITTDEITGLYSRDRTVKEDRSSIRHRQRHETKLTKPALSGGLWNDHKPRPQNTGNVYAPSNNADKRRRREFREYKLITKRAAKRAERNRWRNTMQTEADPRAADVEVTEGADVTENARQQALMVAMFDREYCKRHEARGQLTIRHWYTSDSGDVIYTWAPIAPGWDPADVALSLDARRGLEPGDGQWQVVS